MPVGLDAEGFDPCRGVGILLGLDQRKALLLALRAVRENAGTVAFALALRPGGV